MLKELEEPGKERTRHLNHRKEKAAPRDWRRENSSMQSNPQTHDQQHLQRAGLVAWRAEQATKGAWVPVAEAA